jgi:hypothetical protein
MSLIVRSRVSVGRLLVAQVLKKFRALYEVRIFMFWDIRNQALTIHFLC